MVYLYSVPVMSLALVAGAVASRGLPSGRRRASLAAAILLACGALMLVRTNGVTGDAMSDFEWRWTPTAEERLLARADDVVPAKTPETRSPNQPSEPAPAPPTAPPIAEVPEKDAVAAPTSANAEVKWSGFRGPARDSTIRGVRIDTDWSRTPPVELWRRPIGPAWSSFAVSGDRLFTQEQRGEDEMVSAYDVKTGNPVWKHRDAARFWESNAGAGPRGTPTLHNGRVYTLGGTGHLERARRARRLCCVVAQRRRRHRRKDPGLGHRELAPRGERRRRCRYCGKARRLRSRHGEAAMVRPEGRLGLQLAAPDDDRRRRAGRADKRTRRRRRRAFRRHRAVEARVGAATASCSLRCSREAIS